MIGLEYISNLYNKQYKDVAEELGISKQVVNSWIKGRCNISNKHIPKLAKMFNQSEEYFQKELTEIDKLTIQKVKYSNEMTEFEYEEELTDGFGQVVKDKEGNTIMITKTYIDSGDTFAEQYTDMNISLEKCVQEIRETVNNRFDENIQYADVSGYEALSSADSLVELYIDFINLIKKKKIDESLLRIVIKGIAEYSGTSKRVGRSKDGHDEYYEKIAKLLGEIDKERIGEAKLWASDEEVDDLL